MKRKFFKGIVYCIAGILTLTGISACGQKEQEGGGIYQERERTAYDLASEKWKGFDESNESKEAWTITDYWDDSEMKVPEPDMIKGRSESAVDGTDYYIFDSFRGGMVTGESTRKYYLTCINTLTFETKSEKLDFLGEDSETVQLAEAIEEGWANVIDIDILEGRISLLISQYDKESRQLSHVYIMELDSQWKVQNLTDLKPELEKNGMIQEKITFDAFWRDKDGRFYMGIWNETATEIAVFNNNGEFAETLRCPGNFEGLISCIGRLPDGYPVFECMDPESENNILFCFDGKKEKILYQGKLSYSPFRHMNGYGEVFYIEHNKLLRWDAAKGKCESICKSKSLQAQQLKGILEQPDGTLTMAFYDNEMTYMFRLRPGADLDEKELVVFASSEDSDFTTYLDDYSLKHPGVKITMISKKWEEDWDMVMNRLMAQITEGKGPDMFLLTRNDLEIFQKQGILADLSEVLPEDTMEQIFPGVVQYGMIGDKLYGIAYSASSDTLAVSKEAWPEDTWTIKDMMELMETGGKDGRGYEKFIDNVNADQILFDLVTNDIMIGKSSFIDTEKRQCYFDTEEFKEILEFSKKYGRDPEKEDYLGPEEMIENIREGKTLAFIVGAHGSNFASFSRDMQALGDGYKCVGYPSDGDYSGYVSCTRSIAIKADSKNIDIAKDFIQYIISEGTQRRKGLTSVRKDVLVNYVKDNSWENEEGYREPAFWINSRTVTPLKGKPDGSSFLPEYLEIMEKGVPKPTEWDALGRIIGEEAAPFFNGDKSVEDVAEIIQSRVWLYLNENFDEKR